MSSKSIYDRRATTLQLYSPYSTKDVQECRCGSSNCRGILGPRLKDNKKLVDKAGKGRVAHGKKRKIGGPASTALAAEVVKELSQKRKVPPMPKGWVYVDEGMEKIRIEEARKDKEIAWLQKEGISPATFRIVEPEPRTRSSENKESMRSFGTTNNGTTVHRTKIRRKGLNRKS